MSEPHERIERAIAGLGSEYEPPAGWEARVLAAAAPKRRWWLIAVPAAVALAAVIIIVIGLRGSSTPRPLALAVAIEASGAVVRGTTAKPGDTVLATASGGTGERAVWIYRGDRELVVACSGAKPCRAMLATVGTYTVIAVTARTPLPAPTGSLDDDLAAALAAGASHTTQKIEVR
jgi:hypothetical protein